MVAPMVLDSSVDGASLVADVGKHTLDGLWNLVCKIVGIFQLNEGANCSSSYGQDPY